MDIEELALLAVKNEIAKYDFLVDYTNTKDKIPMWDGEIYVYNEGSKYNSNKDFKGQIDKFVTIIFTDKDKEELNYPEELYECLDVHFSKNYNDSILNYDFTQLFL